LSLRHFLFPISPHNTCYLGPPHPCPAWCLHESQAIISLISSLLHINISLAINLLLYLPWRQLIGKQIGENEQLQQFAKSTWHPRIFAKTTKYSLQQVGKTTWQFASLAKFPLHLANMSNPLSLGITCIPICQLVLSTCWRLSFVILVKILGCQVLLPSPNSKLLKKTSSFTWYLVLGLGKTIDLPSEF